MSILSAVTAGCNRVARPSSSSLRGANATNEANQFLALGCCAEPVIGRAPDNALWLCGSRARWLARTATSLKDRRKTHASVQTEPSLQCRAFFLSRNFPPEDQGCLAHRTA